MVSSEQKPTRRGIYLLPNLLTSGAMFAGFYAIVTAMDGFYSHAAIAVFIAALLDGLDGRVARMTNTQTAFGVQYDSLSDLVSFGIAPALVTYIWSLKSLAELGPMWGKVGWAAAFLYAACAALRLARFNTQAEVADKRFFQGLASPASASVLMGGIWLADAYGFTGKQLHSLVAPVISILGLLMVSNVRYFSFKAWPGKERDHVPFLWIVAFVGILVLLAIEPPVVLFVTFTAYAISGPVITVAGKARARGKRRSRRQSE